MIKTSTYNNIGMISMENFDTNNAIGTEMLHQMIRALDKFSKNKNVDIILICSQIDNIFSSGSDCCELQHLNEAEAKIFAMTGQRLIRKIKDIKKIVVAAVDGKAFGAGFEIALAADVLFATERSLFAFPEVSHGIIPGFGGTQLAARKIYETFVKYLVFTGDTVSTEGLNQKGFIAQSFSKKDTMIDGIHEFADKLSSKSMFALGLAKETINAGIEADLDKALLIEQNAFTVAFSSNDKIEGMTAFIEKRKPVFTDRWENFEEL